MTAFLWTLITLWTLSFVGCVIWLVRGIPELTRRQVGCELVIKVVLLVWAIVLVAR